MVDSTDPDEIVVEYFVQYRMPGGDTWYSDLEPDTEILLEAERKAVSWRRGDSTPKGAGKITVSATRIIQRITIVNTLHYR